MGRPSRADAVEMVPAQGISSTAPDGRGGWCPPEGPSAQACSSGQMRRSTPTHATQHLRNDAGGSGMGPPR